MSTTVLQNGLFTAKYNTGEWSGQQYAMRIALRHCVKASVTLDFILCHWKGKMMNYQGAMQELRRCYKAEEHKFPVAGRMVEEIWYSAA